MESMKRRNPVIAGILSLLTLGLGQVYNGQLMKGIIFWIIGLFGVFLIFLGVSNTFPGVVVYLIILLAFDFGVLIDSIANSIRRKEYQPKPYNKWYIYCLIIFGLLSLSLVFVVKFPIKGYIVDGVSMNPGLLDRDRIMVNMDYYTNTPPKRGDLALLHFPIDSSRIYIKRIIALPGETIEIKNGQLAINGVLNEVTQYFKEAPIGDFEKYVVPSDAVFVMGDNVNNSNDSRSSSFGAVKVSSLLGKALYIYWAKDRQRIGKTL